jgi:hypothetical protein
MKTIKLSELNIDNETYRDTVSAFKEYLPYEKTVWKEELEKLNNLRILKNRVPVDIDYIISDDLLTITLGLDKIEELVDYKLSLFTTSYVESIIFTKALELIANNYKKIEAIKTTEIQDFKHFRNIANRVILNVLTLWDKDLKKKSFEEYFYKSEQEVLNDPDRECDVFEDWSKLKDYVMGHITDFGYIVIENKIKAL